MTTHRQSGTLGRLLSGGVFCGVWMAACGCPYDEKLGFTDYQVPENYTTTASGLQYRIVVASDGPHPTKQDVVRVHYRGWLDDGTVFDDSYKRGQASEFPLTSVVAGWTEGVPLVGVGGKIELVVPPELGYGAEGGPVPPNARLHFVIELLAIK